VFLKSYLELEADFRQVQSAMDRRPRRWLEGMAEDVRQEGEELLLAVGFEVGGRRFDRAARLDVGELVTTDRVASLPLRFSMDDHERLFPAMEGTLDAAWLGMGRTHLSLCLQYEPPFGIVGQGMDRALLHRVAEAVARQFLERAAVRLGRELTPALGRPELAGRPEPAG
jgi:hypothetical protein